MPRWSWNRRPCNPRMGARGCSSVGCGTLSALSLTPSGCDVNCENATHGSRLSLYTLFLLLSLPASLFSATITDNFNTSVDYRANGVAGTIWDGVYLGAGEFANTGTGGSGAGSTVQCDANIVANNMLTVQSTATDWEGTGDDGFFLFKVVRGDFSAIV